MRTDQFVTFVSVDGTPLPYSWDTTAGGDVDSNEIKYRPGGMHTERAIGGPRIVSNLTVTKMMELPTDWATMLRLMPRVGKAKVVVTRVPLDPDANPVGAPPLIYTGVLKTVIPPEHAAEGNAIGMWQLVISSERAD